MNIDVDKAIVEAVEETVLSRGQEITLANKILTWVGEIHSSNESLEDKNSVASRIESLLASTKE
jgi:hypothetical protein